MTHAPTHLTALKLFAFRNHAALKLGPLDARPVVITGPNGAGKTNVLEALSLLAPGRGLRRAPYAEIAQRDEAAPGAGSWAVAAEAIGRLGEVALGTGMVPSASGGASEGRRVRVNGAPARTISELSEHLSFLWLTPSLDGLFTGAASERRRFLDRLVQALDPGHAVLAGRFERALRQRNRRLDEASSLRDATLDALEREAAGLGIALSAARLSAVTALEGYLARHDDTAFPQAAIRLDGEAEDWLRGADATAAEEIYIRALRDARPRDRAAGRTLTGPHRADLIVTHVQKGREARHASTGEQKALLIGLTLAEARLVTEATGSVPVLLLDEVAAHLDPGRREGLFDALLGLRAQAWMTGTEPAPFEALGTRAQHLSLGG